MAGPARSELLETVGPLTDPTKYGGTPGDAFHLVLPSLPGYGFSGEPTELGWESGRIARAWAELMDRLGYTRYVAQGGDVGAFVTDAMGRQGPEGLLGIHINLLIATLGLEDQLPAESEQERAGHDAIKTITTSGFGYFLEQSTRPPGAIGIAPSANLNPEGTYPSLFEPIHGSAPDIAGEGLANPSGAIWAGAMMLDHAGFPEAGARVLNALEETLASGTKTSALGGTSTTDEMADAVVQSLRDHA